MPKFAERISYMQASADAVRELFENMADPSVISFGGGAPAREALPVETIHEIATEVLARDARGVEALQYGNPKGVADLRQAVAEKLLAPKGINANPDDVMIFGGGMEAVYMAGQILLEKGDVVLVESPTFVQSVQTFEMFQARCVACETDAEGFVIEDVLDKIKTLNPKLIYIIPTFQNPSGRTTTEARRKKLAEIAAEYDVMILEDDPYGDMRYSGKPLPPVKAFDKSGNVIYANSFSKIFAPGSRLGYIYADPEVIKRLYNAKTGTNSHVGMISQVLCAEFFKKGCYEPHLKRLCDIHRERRDVMMECVSGILPEGSSSVYPDGGLFTWVELPERFNTTVMVERALEKKVFYMPGEKFFTSGQPIRTNCMRISFGGVTPDKIRLGMEKLGEVIRSYNCI